MKEAIFACKSRSNLFLKPTSTKQWGLSILLKETMGAFDWTQTHDWQVSTDNKSDTLPTVPHHLLIVNQKGQVFYHVIFSILVSMSDCLW